MCFAFGFVCNLVTAQKVEWLPTRPYEKIKFDSLQPVWYHTFMTPKVLVVTPAMGTILWNLLHVLNLLLLEILSI